MAYQSFQLSRKQLRAIHLGNAQQQCCQQPPKKSLSHRRQVRSSDDDVSIIYKRYGWKERGIKSSSNQGDIFPQVGPRGKVTTSVTDDGFQSTNQ
mmetsp:Transcript_28761/g.68515  ORF Transcript_28761/g.68515 Transcript_28761/m.68515 type:complete len:95 (-) Transcript_28761:331-615(-)